MHGWSRRDLLKTGMVAPAAAAAMPPLPEEQQAGAASAKETEQGAAHRERLLLDSGWRFHFGHANDSTKDFSFGRSGTFSKTGNFIAPGRVNYSTTATGKPWTCRTIGPSSCPSRTIRPSQGQRLLSAGPELSRDQRRLVPPRLRASGGGRGQAHRPSNSTASTATPLSSSTASTSASTISGYAPFRFDVTDFAMPGSRNVLLVRVDATLSDGWFYEGAGIYRHVWLVKTQPVHVNQWGTLVRSEVRAGEATRSDPHRSGQRGQGRARTRA